MTTLFRALLYSCRACMLALLALFSTSVARAQLPAKLSQKPSPSAEIAAVSPWTNSLGMKFVPVPGTKVLFSIWDTRVKDFKAFCDETGRKWKPGCSPLGYDNLGHWVWHDADSYQTENDPAVNVSWDDAKAFCDWLTQRDRKLGLLKTKQSYRLPTDAEWSIAAGGGKYVWGDQWPPPKGAGNYARSLELDEFEKTSPVGSFTANKYGLDDMSGNVWQWTEDWYRKEMNSEELRKSNESMNKDKGGHFYKVKRGGSWRSFDSDFSLLSTRTSLPPDYPSDDCGFRVVIAPKP